jgi:hypothetical protein
MKDFQRILDYLYDDNDLVCVATIPDFANRKQRFARIEDLKQEKWQRFLKAANARGSNIYLSVYAFTRNERTENAVTDTADRIFLDFDQPGAYENFRKDYEPSIVINTSPGKHQCFLRLSEPVNKLEAKAIAKALAQQYNADSTFDLARIFRLPGFRNRKYQERPLVTISEFNPDIVYAAYNLPAELSKVSAMQREKKDIPNIIPRQNNSTAGFSESRSRYDYQHFLEKAPAKHNGEKDYSSADMAYAIYRLGQGDDNQTVIQEILQSSPGLSSRKGAGIENYLNKTVSRAKEYQANNYKS